MKQRLFAARSFLLVSFLMLFVSALAYAQPACKGKELFTSTTCSGDSNSSDETALAELVNRYRKSAGQPEVRLSPSLSKLANRRLLDMQQNTKSMTHSWSNCPYDISVESTWQCVTEAPKRLNSGYNGEGYETLYHVQSGRATPDMALTAWKQSTLHNSIILNLGMFKPLRWDEMGVGIDGQYAVLWFGYPGDTNKPPAISVTGLGVSYEQAVSGMATMLSIQQASSTVESNKWQGFSSDKKIKLEIYGSPKEISEAAVNITIKLEGDGKLDAASKSVLSKFLTNIFPDWPDVDGWIERSTSAIAQNRTASRTKLVRKIAIEMSADGQSSIRVSIAPQSKPKSTEVF